MSAFPLTRRAGLVAFAALALQGCATAVPTAATSGLRIRAIKVDVSPIRASMGDPTAAWVEQALPGALARSLAPDMAPGDRNGATLVARIDTLYLGTSGGGPGFFDEGLAGFGAVIPHVNHNFGDGLVLLKKEPVGQVLEI